MRTLVLDLGGVFYPASEPDAAWWSRWASQCAMPADDLAARFWHGPDIERANVGAISAEDYYARSASRLNLAVDLVRAMVVELFVGEPNLALIDFVRALRASGVPVSALTNSWAPETELMARPEFSGLFDHIISSADVGTTKPGDAIYRIVMDRLGLAPADAVFVDDNAGNVAAARALGWEAIRFVDTAQAIAEIDRAFGG
jgi:epoxide hydrolase-like predicted phosphatase